MFIRKEEIKTHVPARVRAYGRARIEIAQRAQTPQDWNELWKPPVQPFAFEWGQHWKQCIEYKVKDFTEEVGFFIDLLGLPVNAFNENYAMFTSPDQEFYFAVVQAGNEKATPPDALRIQFMVADIFKTSEELQKRGIHFTQEPEPVSPGSNQWVASFRTPNGICMEVWGWVTSKAADARQTSQQEKLSSSRVEEASREAEIETPVKDRPAKVETEHRELYQPNRIQQPVQQEAEDEEDEFDWSLPEDLEDEVVTETQVNDEMESDESESEQPRLSLFTSPKTVERPVPVRSFQSAEEMLNHLKEKQLRSESAVKPTKKLELPVENTKPNFSPAPKKETEKKTGSVWDQVKMDEEYVDLDGPATEEYHYQPIPMKRKE